jgi:hypothetical protein
MSGHNSEHSHVHKHNSSGSHSSKPCDVLMRQHHFSGGISNLAPRYSHGGKACHGGRFSKGGYVEHEKHGGRTMKRRHHAEGGGENEYGEKPLTGQLRRGGRARHAEGMEVQDNSVRQEQKRGGRSKRSHHYWGQDVIGRLPLIGGLANSISNTVGTLDDDQYGGANYVADTPGRKAADIISTIGGLGTNLLMSHGGGKGSGGGAPAKKRGGRIHRAAGGAGKVRKGMMTESGKMIHHG